MIEEFATEIARELALLGGLFSAIAPWRLPLVRVSVLGKAWVSYVGPAAQLHRTELFGLGLPLIFDFLDPDAIGPDEFAGLRDFEPYLRAAIIFGADPTTAEVENVLELAAEHRIVAMVETTGGGAGAWLSRLRSQIPCAGVTIEAGARQTFTTTPKETAQ